MASQIRTRGSYIKCFDFNNVYARGRRPIVTGGRFSPYLNIMFEGCRVALFLIQQVKPLVGSGDRFADGPGNA